MNATEVEIAAVAKRTQPLARRRFVARVYWLTNLFTVQYLFRWRRDKDKVD